MTQDKIKTLDELITIVKILKHEGKKIVTTNGSFDIFHAGHVKALEESKTQGDILIVGINSDSSVRAYKSADRPINGERERALVVAGMACVDYVFIFNEENPIEFLKVLKPDVHTNSAEYGKNCVEAKTVEENNGRLYLIKKMKGLSTSEIITKIKNG